MWLFTATILEHEEYSKMTLASLKTVAILFSLKRFFMDNRRNFYRILRVQPDATHEVIQQSYRSLMQKLRLHPDLGGEEHNARIINEAYAVLRNPKLRAAYNSELLGKYHIKTLSRGSKFSPGLTVSNHHSSSNNNQRNYYRILHIQNDAEMEIIKASYRVLSRQLTGDKLALLDEAFTVIGNQTQRSQYDALLKLFTHAKSVEKLDASERSRKQTDDAKIIVVPTTKQSNIPQAIKQETAYEPVIKQYCQFCKTPYIDGSYIEQEQLCIECSSPLSLLADTSNNIPLRSLSRIQQSETASIYAYWPGNPTQVSLEDLSPTGLSFSTPQPFDIHQVIKVDAHHFKAIAQIVYCRKTDSKNSVGASFLTIKFLRSIGNFLSTSA